MLLSFVWALSGFRGSSARLLCALLGFEVLRSIFLVRIRRVCHTSASLWGSRFVAVRCLRVSVCVVLGFVFFEFCSPTALLGCFAPRLAVPPLCCLEIRVVPSIVLVGPFEHQPRLAVLPLCCFGVWVLAVHGSYCSPFSHSRFTMLALRCFMSFYGLGFAVHDSCSVFVNITPGCPSIVF